MSANFLESEGSRSVSHLQGLEGFCSKEALLHSPGTEKRQRPRCRDVMQCNAMVMYMHSSIFFFFFLISSSSS
jgi:hypothetical protein